MTDLAEIGPHDWQNYVDYWRDTDAEWLQSRSILRANTTAELTTLFPAPGVGQVVHVKDVTATQKDILFLYSGGSGTPAWVPYQALPKNLFASEDTNLRVTLGHHPANVGAVVPALTLSPTGVDVITELRVKTTLKVTANDVQIKSGSNKNVVLTTDAAGLVSDSPIKAPGITVTGPITTTTTISATSVTAGTLTSTGGINANTAAITAGLSAGQVTAGPNAAGGVKSGNAHFFGDGNGVVLRVPGWAAPGTQLLVRGDHVWIEGGNTYMENQLLIRGGRSIYYYDAQGNHTGYGGPVIYSGAAPANPVNGTIWVIP